MTANKHGIELLQDPALNQSTAFSEAGKQALALWGLVPDVTETEDLQLSRVMMQLGHKNTDLERYIYLLICWTTTRHSSIGPFCQTQSVFFRSSTIRPSRKPVSSSATFTGKLGACISQFRAAGR